MVEKEISINPNEKLQLDNMSGDLIDIQLKDSIGESETVDFHDYGNNYGDQYGSIHYSTNFRWIVKQCLVDNDDESLYDNTIIDTDSNNNDRMYAHHGGIDSFNCTDNNMVYQTNQTAYQVIVLLFQLFLVWYYYYLNQYLDWYYYYFYWYHYYSRIAFRAMSVL